MGEVTVTRNGKSTNINQELFVLIYMPFEQSAKVIEYLEKNKLADKFKLIEAEISVMFVDEAENDNTCNMTDPIKTLVLEMRNEKVLFEYKLSGKIQDLINDISKYVND